MNKESRLANTGCFILDLDGTFYLENRLLPGAAEFLNWLENHHFPYLFLTNNSSRQRKQYAAKLASLGITIAEEKIFTSGEAGVLWLKQNSSAKKVFVMGTPALEEEFASYGYVLTEDKPDYIVLGFDTTLTYAKLWKLCDLVRSGLPYLATHPDFNCPVEGGFMPDIGAMIAFVEASTGRKPDIIIGKPYLPIVEALSARTGLPAQKLTMIGDRLYTDIALGKAGMTTVLVLSGETGSEDLLHSPFEPDYIMSNLAELLETIKTYRLFT